MSNTLPIDYLRSRLRYDSESGFLFWKSFEGGWGPCLSKNVGKKAGAVTKHGYIYLFIDRKSFFAHRIAWAIHTGEWPVGEIDHINGIKTDNRIENLRDASRFDNQRNKSLSPKNKTGIPGVIYRNGKYSVSIGRGKGKHLGTFGSIEEAHEIRILAEIDRGYHPNHGRPFQTPEESREKK